MWWTVAGLGLDLLGVMLLGLDLVRLQHQAQREADETRAVFDELAEGFGGVQKWAENIRRNARWISSHEYSRYHAEDETSFNARQTLDAIKEVAGGVEGLAETVSGIVRFLDDDASRKKFVATHSIRFSIVGLILILVGFSLQGFGVVVSM